MTNSANPDQMASEPTDLNLHCFQRQGIPGSAGPGLTTCNRVCKVLTKMKFTVSIYSSGAGTCTEIGDRILTRFQFF